MTLALAAALATVAVAARGGWEHHPEAQALNAARAHYQTLAERGWPALPAGPPLRRGVTAARALPLRERLIATGDLRASSDRGERVDVELESAVRLFQYRHGLRVDGVVGPATRRALNVSAAARLNTIDVNLRRWHLLEGRPPPRYLSVNSAAAELRLIENGTTRLRSRVIVGSTKHPTPELTSQIEAVVINPSWHVPRSIAVNEILPKLRRRPDWLASAGMIIVDRPADPHGLTIDWPAVTAAGFHYRLRQPPGPGNPLGRIKLDFPNRYSVYLHDTAEPQLFGRAGRALSHGCVRVQKPQQLARLLLADQGWSDADVAKAVADGATRRVPLSAPLPIYLRYFTAFVDGAGLVHFRQDVYRRDAAPLAITARDCGAAAPPGHLPLPAAV